ncbi:MAG: 23S rRNA (adenine(2030)-N(6))-methyltransferase RlmJ [Methylovulum sp.]|jgi:23S rRNA (adenine2030-N6)-methyltransferase
MLSYRHAYHAGNFADVLKHLTLINILNYLTEKDKSCCYMDTHAGGGDYNLRSEYAQKNREYETGIAKLWLREDLPEAIAAYVKVIKAFTTSTQLTRYPGSPLIAQHLLRGQDRLELCELHNTEIHALKQTMFKDKRVRVWHEDGMQFALKALPPKERRGLILIDPSYELKTEYAQVIKDLIAMVKRFSTGTYALWYPVIERARIKKMERSLVASNIKNILLVELGIRPDSLFKGMTASGMIIINPPFTLVAKMQNVLPWLAQELGEQGQGSYRNEMLVSE